MKNSRVIVCTHKDYAHQNIKVDFSELWEGAPEIKEGSAGSNWLGTISGRPRLADQLIDGIRLSSQGKKPSQLRAPLPHFRAFFRFLDAYEKWVQTQEATNFKAEIEGLEDIETHHLQLWKTPSPGGEWKQPHRRVYNEVCSCLRSGVKNLGLPELITPAYPRKATAGKDNVDEATGRRIVIALARAAIEIFKHWDRSDKLAAEGRDLTGMQRTTNRSGKETIQIEGGVNEADLHATYRALVAKRGVVRIGRNDFLMNFGYKNGKNGLIDTPSWWPKYQDGPNAGQNIALEDLQSGQYPFVEDLAVLFLVFLARTGWNPATAEMLDISNEDKWCKQYTEKYMWLFAFKHRANDWQDTVSITQQRTGAYQIIRLLMARTRPLRELIIRNPSLSENHLISERSPWISVRATGNRGGVAGVCVEVGSHAQTTALRKIIEAHNKRQDSPEKHIPLSLVPGDLRDIFGAFAFKNSEYSLFITQMALGHKRGVTIFSYLRRRAWTEESEKKKNALFVALIDQIQTHKKIDMTLLRAQMDGIAVTQEMIDRLDAYRSFRTYTGMGCTDPSHPPRYIDPTNPRDGTSPCAQGHLCPGCSQGKAFNDSLPHLARRCAEVEWLRDTLPLEVYAGSSLVDQLLVLRATLKQWPAKEVDEFVSNWTAQIANGSHKPIRFAGEH